jgi:hypothetical protein
LYHKLLNLNWRSHKDLNPAIRITKPVPRHLGVESNIHGSSGEIRTHLGLNMNQVHYPNATLPKIFTFSLIMWKSCGGPAHLLTRS